MFGKVVDSMSNIVKDTNPGVLESLHCTITEVGIISGILYAKINENRIP